MFLGRLLVITIGPDYSDELLDQRQREATEDISIEPAAAGVGP
ncbi:MAG: hypothetical protein ACXVRQ_10425 [Gaiellaceae bacterium]